MQMWFFSAVLQVMAVLARLWRCFLVRCQEVDLSLLSSKDPAPNVQQKKSERSPLLPLLPELLLLRAAAAAAAAAAAVLDVLRDPCLETGRLGNDQVFCASGELSGKKPGSSTFVLVLPTFGGVCLCWVCWCDLGVMIRNRGLVRSGVVCYGLGHLRREKRRERKGKGR
ncbi:hypothetical protein BX666DRAFT_819167 [Dichotomocladium elegans]|nr:hypothetical protein BX666DRAFT_819167 [Dichotomocladium elegans]